MSKGNKEFNSWLLDKKALTDKDAKKVVSTVVMLEEYARRHSLGDGVLLDATQSQLECFIDVFYSNDFLKKSDDRRDGRLIRSLLLLKEFKTETDNITCEKLTTKIETQKENLPCASVHIGDISKDNNINSYTSVSKSKAKTPEEKLARRIEREFKKYKYIGDIQISDEEYEILKVFFRHGYNLICNSPKHESINPLFAVAMVQIGIRFYNGNFWVYVQKELGLDKLPQHHQSWIGKSFYKTLIHYGKYHVDEREYMNNILLHCFITKYYADDLFDFLFAYYQIDLDRDLTRNNSDMRKYLMQSMSKGETSARAYKIKRHTADAVSANEKGCKIRIGRILRFMDNALFNDIYPTTSQNRIAQLFCSWAASSKKFDIEKKHLSGLTNKGIKRYSMPYLHFDGASNRFFIILPPQYIHLEDDEALPQITWKIIIAEQTHSVDASVDSCVTGCKTEKISDFSIDAPMLMHEIRFELWKNGIERIQRFKIKSDSVRFFNDDWDAIDSASYTNYLPVGEAYAFVEENSVIVSNSDCVVYCEKILGYELYTLELQKGDVLRLPDGKAKSVGKPLEEGLLSQSLVSGAYAIHEDVKYSIYNQIPSVYFRMSPSQENGTLLLLNDKKYRFDIEKCVRFDLDEQTEEKGYILKLDEYLIEDGIYNLRIDVPNSRKDRSFNLALIRNFEFVFNANTYIFEESGYITFPDGIYIESKEQFLTKNENRFDFEISPVKDHLSFVFNSNEKAIDIRIYLPALKWKFDDGEWNIAQPEEIWHKEFPNTIWVKHPEDQITFSMTPIIVGNIEDEENEEENFAVSFSKNKQEHIFQCDTRKMQSWFGYEEALRTLYLETPSQRISFATVVTRCQVNSAEIVENRKDGELIIKSNISGFSDCVADVFYGEELLVEKQEIYTSGIHLKVPFRSGEYRVVYYEWDDDDDDFGLADYREFQTKQIRYQNKYDLSRKQIVLQSAEEKKDKHAIFSSKRYTMKNQICITELQSDTQDTSVCYGTICVSNKCLRARLEFLNLSQTQAKISFYNEEDDDYFDFLFDIEQQTLVTEEDETLSYQQARKRYIFLDSEEYHFNIKVVWR